jgi:transcriptional regulator with XRE-family HTH domain
VEKSLYSVEYRQLCAILRETRQAAGLTQVQLAAALDVPQSFVSKVESGQRRVDVIELVHIARALGTTITTIVDRLNL